MDGEYDNPPFVDYIIRNLLLFIVCVCLPQLLGIQSLVFLHINALLWVIKTNHDGVHTLVLYLDMHPT